MDTIAADLVAYPPGEGPTPRLALDGFDGPLALLLAMARANQIVLACISLPDLIDQLAAALQQAGPATLVSQKGDWLVMASLALAAPFTPVAARGDSGPAGGRRRGAPTA